HLAFEVDDMDEAHHVHERMDCIVHENKGMGIYFITDPDGCWIEIIPSSKIQLNDAFVIGIDVGGTATKLGVFTGSGELVGKHAFASIPVLTKEAFTPIAEQLAIILRASSVSASQVVGVGLAVPGPVTPENEFVVCPNLDLDLHAYKSFLEAEFPKAAVAVINDANAAALGDQWQGSASKSACENFVLVTLGTGIGAGIISRGELLTSSAGAVGEIGHLCVEPVDGIPCGCGRSGCLEQYASAHALTRMARDSMQADSGATEKCGADELIARFPDAKAVFDAAAAGDKVACHAVSRFADRLAFGFAQIGCVLDPAMIVLGGGLSAASSVFIDELRARYQIHVFSACRSTEIVASELGNDCGIYGAAAHALKTVER
ncbi:MAG: ROK family protein, partial [Raoultibacter sp.]